jgi:predicted butyrate kinase (DUF1464 family)
LASDLNHEICENSLIKDSDNFQLKSVKFRNLLELLRALKHPLIFFRKGQDILIGFPAYWTKLKPKQIFLRTYLDNAPEEKSEF